MEMNMPKWLQKCLSCIHFYYKQDDADMIYCRCKNGNCNYKKKIDSESKTFATANFGTITADECDMSALAGYYNNTEESNEADKKDH